MNDLTNCPPLYKLHVMQLNMAFMYKLEAK